MTVAAPPRSRRAQSSTGKEPEATLAFTSTVTIPAPKPHSEVSTLRGTSQIGNGDARVATSSDFRVWPEAGRAAPTSRSLLTGALASIQQLLRAEPDSEVWQATARRLRAATEQERNRSRRHAALALLLADALSYTVPSDLRNPTIARNALTLGWRALSQPFISTETERMVTEALGEAGWQLALPYRGWATSA